MADPVPPSEKPATPWAALVAITLGTFAVLGPLFLHMPVLYDTDSYYHLAIARAYQRHGIIDSLPWAQLSALHEFGDKEFLFHLLLAPVADTETASAGGRLALAGMGSLLVALLAFLGHRAVGRWGLLLPALVFLGSLDAFGRILRLRPELLSLLLLLLALHCAAEGRHRALAPLTFLYTLAYTAFHALVGLLGLIFLQRALVRRRWHWELALYPALGAGLGLILHPHFPRNLVIWKIQTFDFFRLKSTLDVGREIRPHELPDFLSLNALFLVALLALWRSAAPAEGAPPEGAVQRADTWGMAALAFGGLYLLMLRFSLYAVPFIALALLFELRRRGLRPGPSVRLWSGRGISTALVLVLLFGGGLWRTVTLLNGMLRAGENAPVPREVEWRTFGQALAPGARVAAEWGSTHLYMFWAPQATFLNVLDPVFQAVPYPDAHRRVRDLFEGRQVDIPMSLARDLAADHVALSRYHHPPGVLERLRADPRLVPLHDGYTQLFQLRPPPPGLFLLDWHAAPQGATLPPAPGTLAAWPLLPRAKDPTLAPFAAFVDVGSLLAEGRACAGLARTYTVTEPGTRVLRFAPAGASQLFFNNHPLVGVDQDLGAHMGRGLRLPITAEPGDHRLTVLTCRSAAGPAGFYLWEESPTATTSEASDAGSRTP